MKKHDKVLMPTKCKKAEAQVTVPKLYVMVLTA